MNSLSWLTQIAEQSPLLMTAVLMVTAVLVVKVTILLAAAWTAHVLLRRMNPRWSVLLWRLTGVGVMVVIGLAMAPPLVSWAVLPTEDDVPMPSSSFDRLHSASLGSRPVDATPADDPSATDFAAPTDTDERSQAEAHLPWEESIGGSSVTVRNDADFAADSAVPAGLSASQSETAAITPTAQSSRGAFRLMCLWYARFLASTVWTLSGLLRLRRIVCASRAVPDWMTGEAAIVSQRFGNRRGFDVRQSNEVATPCLIGILRPVVLLPSKQSRDIRRGELVAVLAHEAAHVSGRDLTWNTALHALSLVFWFHPLMWCVRLMPRLAMPSPIPSPPGISTTLPPTAASSHGSPSAFTARPPPRLSPWPAAQTSAAASKRCNDGCSRIG